MTPPRVASLALVPGAGTRGEGVLRLQPLAGGTVNDLWRVDTAAGHFVLRQDGAAWRRPGVDRAQEYAAHTLAAAAGIAPRIVARSAASDVWVTEFLAARLWVASDYEQLPQLLRLAACLGALHRLPVPATETLRVDANALAADYARRAAVTPQVTALRAEVAAAQAVLDAAAATPVMVHGDALQGNVLGDEKMGDERIWLIDWEYAKLSDPVWDLAVLAAYYPVAATHLPQLAMAAGVTGSGVQQRLQAALALQRALGRLWYLARGESPPVVLETPASSGQTSAPRD